MEEYISDIVFGHHTCGYLTYMDLLDHFDDFTVYQAKKALNDFTDAHDDKLQKMYDVSCKLAGSSQYFKKLMDEDTVMDLLDDSEKYIVEDVELLMIAGSQNGYCNFLSGKNNHELISIFSEMKNCIDFVSNTDPVRKEIRARAIGDKKIPSPNAPQPSRKKEEIKDVKTKSTNQMSSATAYRKSGKAGAQMKADQFFKKADSQMTSVSKMTPVAPSKLNTQPAQANDENLGKKRKREEIEQKFEKKCSIQEPAKRVKAIDNEDTNFTKAKFDSNLYSLEESSEEIQVLEKPPSPFIKSKPAPKATKPVSGRMKKVESSDEEGMDVDGDNNQSNCQNVSPNMVQGSLDTQVSKGPRKIKKKVKKQRQYLDDDGFQVCEDYSDWEEVEVEDTQVDLKKASKTLEAKKPSYKQPAKGQSSLASFFNKS